MKPLISIAVGTLLAIAGLRFNQLYVSMTVNPLIGDESFVKKFGYKPDATTDDQLRIRTHLEYVEALLRNRTTRAMSSDQQKKRRFLLDKLREYRQRGAFPKNYDYVDERKPCFIDKDGTICAVGYLVEQTAGRKAAEKINTRYQYATVFEMNDPKLLDWIAQSGLSREECQLIQPTYSPPTPQQIPDKYKITNSYAISSALLNGTNVALIGAQLMNRPGINPKRTGTWGALTGLATLTLGLVNLERFSYDQTTNYYGNRGDYSNKAKRSLSMVNIGAGAATTLLSILNVSAYNKSKRAKTVSVNVYSPPVETGSAIGLQVTKRL
ncbi:hypothetical protein GCM10028803_09360 [Larkinella knui]|uniref:Uncharacterized protein n=1 Tax=Larkinella knui TaxID=2025310 RepID=A0A3P1CDB6_9BACT|nr:hypothetical protein [Larkinella knui]RRB11086.1 hypothetical protein EHT87_28520 [Larkinella knui]